ncbi:hypothetical protein BH10PSE7_BH10PSE7_34470 [soil metagenome]
MIYQPQARKGRWTPLGIVAVIAGFIVWWPLGLAAIAYILWGGSIDGLLDECIQKVRDVFAARPAAPFASSEPFEVYRDTTLGRLEAEQARRADYLRRLREASDRAAFDRILSETSGI